MGESVNSPFTEHSPMVSADGKVMVFTSRRPLFANEIPEADGQYTSKLYYTVLQSDGKWSKALPLHPRSSNRAQFSSIQFVQNSEKLLLFSPDHGGSIWETERDGSEFKDPILLRTETPSKFFRPDGNFSPGMDKIIFANNSLFDGTYDLFISEKRTEAKWGKPWKLSKMINTPDDEIAPIWLEDGKTIVFSSKGLNGLGGYDLYKSKYDPETRTFSEPENLGYPINTPGNDTHYFQVDKGRKLFISSARAGGLGSTDIYMLTPNDHSASNSEW
jgi:Tol biopolymer transport system component